MEIYRLKNGGVGMWEGPPLVDLEINELIWDLVYQEQSTAAANLNLTKNLTQSFISNSEVA